MSTQRAAYDNYSLGSFLGVRWELFQICSSPEATIVLAWLINEGRKLTHAEDFDGWISYPISRIKRELEFSDYAQKKTCRELQESGFIKIEKRGMPQRRFVKIQFGRINSAVGDLRPTEEKPRAKVASSKGEGRPPMEAKVAQVRKKRSSYKNVAVPSEASTDSDSSSTSKTIITDFDRSMARGFYKSMKKAGKIFDRSQPKLWPDSFRLIRTTSDLTENQIERILRWYCGEWTSDDQPEFIPEAFTGPTLKKKWVQVVAAFKRHGGNLNGQKKKPRKIVGRINQNGELVRDGKVIGRVDDDED